MVGEIRLPPSPGDEQKALRQRAWRSDRSGRRRLIISRQSWLCTPGSPSSLSDGSTAGWEVSLGQEVHHQPVEVVWALEGHHMR